MTKVPAVSKSGVVAEDSDTREECFVIMPISDQAGYESGHFGKVYEDIFKPACTAAGYKATRADEIKESNLIHLDILKRVVNSPMAICDLSSRNPNVLFELGLRQAFDKPTVLVKDAETAEIFDIAPIRYTPYRQALRYREVLADQTAITEALRSTKAAIGDVHNVNSLIRLLELSGPAKIGDVKTSGPEEYFQILMAEFSQLKRELRNAENNLALVPVRDKGPKVASRSAIFNGHVARLQREMMNGARLESEVLEAIKIGEDALRFYSGSKSMDYRNKIGEVKEGLETLHTMLLI